MPSLLKEPLVIHLAGEKACLFRAVASQFKHCFWLNGLESPDKYYQLKCARLAGLKIPDTFIVSNKKKLTELVHQFGEVITKPLTEVLNFSFQGQIYMSYTQMIDENSLASIPEFFTTLWFKEI
ncbi:MAG: hypothetical protein IPJ20_20810 [Flammeovirgaceae bacterium]|nr:hypothetical protein [Flammeovirgaceae bacterium]